MGGDGVKPTKGGARSLKKTHFLFAKFFLEWSNFFAKLLFISKLKIKAGPISTHDVKVKRILFLNGKYIHFSESE
jgi:hypothetical protein